jgi:hypothetical protein
MQYKIVKLDIPASDLVEGEEYLYMSWAGAYNLGNIVDSNDSKIRILENGNIKIKTGTIVAKQSQRGILYAKIERYDNMGSGFKVEISKDTFPLVQKLGFIYGYVWPGSNDAVVFF